MPSSKSLTYPTPGPKAIALLKRFEGLRLETYRDAAGKRTIGYGHVILPTDHNQDWMTIAQADALLLQDLAKTASSVARLVHVQVSQSQMDALCCFAFNIGVNAFARSTLLRKLNDGHLEQAADEFSRWNKVTHSKTGTKVVLAGLTNRRLAERTLFISCDEE